MNFPLLLSLALMGKNVINQHCGARRHLLIYSTLIFTLIFICRTTQITEISTLCPWIYVARHFHLAYSNTKTFIGCKKAPFLVRSFTTESICCSQKGQHCDNGPEWRKSGANGLAYSVRYSHFCIMQMSTVMTS